MPLFILAAILLLGTASARADLSGALTAGAEETYFPDEPQLEEQEGRSNFSGSLAFKSTYSVGESHLFKTDLFGRLDQSDPNRTHADARVFSYVGNRGTLQWTLGMSQVTWGVAESRNIVDIINQKDTVEDFGEKTKLGQSMAHLSWEPGLFRFDSYILPFFRERTFPSRKGRPRTEPYINPDRTTYAARDDVDFAGKASVRYKILDLSINAFYGNSRDPTYDTILVTPFRNELAPHYDVITQWGTFGQLTVSSLLLKFEGVHRSGRDRLNNFDATVSGLEYTFGGTFGTGADFGVIVEYLYDSRGRNALTIFENDLFVGARIFLNDTGDTNLVIAGIFDANNDNKIGSIDFVTRLGDAWRAKLRGSFFGDISASDKLRPYEYDSFLRMTIERSVNF